MVDRSAEQGLERLTCEACRENPEAYWDSEIGTIVLVCYCGERAVPRDAVLEHDLMTDGTRWLTDYSSGSDTNKEATDE